MTDQISAYPHTERDLLNFWRRVDKSGNCWLWTGATFDERGYGVFTLRRRAVRAHRFIWHAVSGQNIPDGMVVRHRCDNPRCVNPEHLELGTQQENVADRQARDRTARGEVNGNSKLTSSQVLAIRSDLRGARPVAKCFCVSRSIVQKIRQRKVWGHV